MFVMILRWAEDSQKTREHGLPPSVDEHLAELERQPLLSPLKLH